MKADPVQKRIHQLGPWFHNLHFANGIQTAPEHPLGDFPAFKWKQIEPFLPQDLTTWSVLDIGCNAGFYSFELAKKGAAVMGVDSDEKYLRQARWAARRLKLERQPVFRRRTVYSLAGSPKRFDCVLFMGIFYHLRYPLLGLDIAARKAKKLLLFQSLTIPDSEEQPEATDRAVDLSGLSNRQELATPGWPRMAFIEGNFAGDPTNWWVPNKSGIRSMIRSCGLKIVAEPGDEIYLCEADVASNVSPFAESDYRAVVGRRS